MKLEKVQKNVLSSSGTNVHVGSGWKPVRIGLLNVETFCAMLGKAKIAAAKVVDGRRRIASYDRR